MVYKLDFNLFLFINKQKKRCKVKKLNHFSTRFKAVRQVLEAYPEVFEGKPQLEEALASFNAITNELAAAITPLVVPYNALRAEMAQSREVLRAELTMLLSLSGIWRIGPATANSNSR